MHERARRRPGEEIANHDAAVLRHKNIAHNERLAAGSGEPQHLPIVEDLGLGKRHEQISDRARVADLAEKDAEDRPLRMVAAARKAVMPAEPPAAWDGRRGGAGGERGRSDRVRIVAPHIDLRLFGIGGDDPLVLAEHGIDPGRGGAAIGQFLDNLREQAEAALQPAKPPGLQDLKDAGVVVFGDRLGGHAARRRAGRTVLDGCRR